MRNKKEKNWSKLFCLNLVETPTLKKQHEHPTVNIIVNNSSRYLHELDQQNSFWSEPGAKIVLYT